jgi:hypothetical protein
MLTAGLDEDDGEGEEVDDGEFVVLVFVLPELVLLVLLLVL